MLKRFLTYPATPMLILGSVYVLVAVPAGQKVSMFSAIAAMSVGVAEILVVGGHILNGRVSTRTTAPRIALGTGALLLSYGSIDPALLPNLLGGVLFAGGLLAMRA